MWVEPHAMQHGNVQIRYGDVIANLAYHERCTLWFDHHESNRISSNFNGVFKIAPSAAGIIFEFFTNKNVPGAGTFNRDYSRLVAETDRIDAATLSLDEVLHLEKYPYVALSSTISSHKTQDEPYWNRLTVLLREHPIEQVLADPEVKQRIEIAVAADNVYRRYLEKYTQSTGNVTVTDFRPLIPPPSGNRFLVFSLFPESVVNVKVRYDSQKKEKVVLSIGHSIFNRGCQVSAGEICAHFSGGGHRGAGSCSVPTSSADQALATICEILLKNNPSSFPIIYEDQYLIAADKPSGLLSRGTRVLNYKEKLFPVFPLTKASSGIVLFAKNLKTKRTLREMADAKQIKRIFLVNDGKKKIETFENDETTVRRTLVSVPPKLHSMSISFIHPVSGKSVILTSPSPRSFDKNPR